HRPMRAAASSAITSEKTLRPVKTGRAASQCAPRGAAVYDSARCTRASIPEAAVTPAGAPRVSSASTIAAAGTRYGLETPTLSSRSGSVTTATGVASDPVPAVVGTATSGVTGPGTRFSP